MTIPQYGYVIIYTLLYYYIKFINHFGLLCNSTCRIRARRTASQHHNNNIQNVFFGGTRGRCSVTGNTRDSVESRGHAPAPTKSVSQSVRSLTLQSPFTRTARVVEKKNILFGRKKRVCTPPPARAPPPLPPPSRQNSTVLAFIHERFYAFPSNHLPANHLPLRHPSTYG